MFGQSQVQVQEERIDQASKSPDPATNGPRDGEKQSTAELLPTTETNLHVSVVNKPKTVRKAGRSKSPC